MCNYNAETLRNIFRKNVTVNCLQKWALYPFSIVMNLVKHQFPHCSVHCCCPLLLFCPAAENGRWWYEHATCPFSFWSCGHILDMSTYKSGSVLIVKVLKEIRSVENWICVTLTITDVFLDSEFQWLTVKSSAIFFNWFTHWSAFEEVTVLVHG